MNTGQKILNVARLFGRSRGLGGFGVVKDGPVIGAETLCCGVGFELCYLLKVAQMANAKSGIMGGTCAGHVDRDRSINPAAHDSMGEGACPADLLGHGKDFKAMFVGLGLKRACIGLNRIKIKDIGVGWHSAFAVKRHGGFDEFRITTAQDIKKHVTGSFLAGFFAQ